MMGVLPVIVNYFSEVFYILYIVDTLMILQKL